MEKIVFLDRGTLPVQVPRPAYAHEWREFEHTPPEETVPRLQDASIAITNKVKLQERELSQLPSLRLIAVAATGYDCVDVAAARSRGIRVLNVPGYTGASVPEHVFALLLALRRNLLSYHQRVQEGAWQKASHFVMLDYPVEPLSGATLGLIGYGQLAKEVEKRALAFGMRVLIAERNGAASVRAGRTAFQEVLGSSDVISLHCPLTPETKGLMGAPEFRQMKKTALFINTARGALVDEQALAEALSQDRLGGAGIDVLGEEPPRHGSPLLALKHPRLLITPHIGWTSREALEQLASQIAVNIESFIRGKPQNVVA